MARQGAHDHLAPDLLDRVRARFADWPVTEGLGLEVLELKPGWARIRLPLHPRVVNGARGNMNGGWIANLGDMACAFALCTHFDGAMPFATSDLHTRFLEPALGEVVAEAVVVRKSRTSAVLECRMCCGEVMVAFATAHFAIRSKLSG
jgi:acyl-CoA thioesterase